MKKYSSALHRAIAAALTFAAVCLFAILSASAAENEFEVKIIDAEIKSIVGIEGESTVSFVDDAVYPNLGTFTMPGANAEIELTIKNTGTLEATLVSLENLGCTLEDFRVYLTDGIQGEALKHGELCTITAVVEWDKNSTRSFEEKNDGNFAFKLVYVNEQDKQTAPSESIPDPSNQNATSAVKFAATVDTPSGVPSSGGAIATGAATAIPVILLATVATYIIVVIKAKED